MEQMGSSQLIGEYTYTSPIEFSMWGPADIFFQIISLAMLIGILCIGVLTIILMIKGIKALNVYMKKTKLEIPKLEEK